VADPRIRVTADTSQAERELKSLENAMSSLNNSAALAGKALAVITAAGAAMGFAIKKSLDSVDELAKTSRTLGMTAADLQAFRNSASLAGVGSDELTASLRRLQVNIGNAITKGTGPAKDALDRLGLSMKELQGLNAQEQFQRIAEEVAKIPDPAQRAATATELLGRQGPRLLEAANEFERMRREAEQLGIALSETDTAAIERANDAMSELLMIATGFVQKLTAEIAPILIVIADRIKLSVMEMGGLDKIIRERVVPAFKLAIQVAAALMGYIAAAKIIAIVVAFGKLALQVVAVARAMRTLGVAAAAAKAIATGGLSALVTLTAGLAGAIAAGVAAGKAMDGLFEDAQIVTAEIAANVEEQRDALQDSVLPQEQITDSANKALEAYNQMLSRLREQVQYQRDVINLGEQEARIQQVIRQERQRLVEAGSELSAQQEQNIRNLLTEENILKRQVTLRKQQTDAILNALRESGTALQNQLVKLDELQLLRAGKTMEEIAELRRKMVENDLSMQDAAVQQQQALIQRTVNNEISKYNKLFSLRNKYDQDLAALDDILQQHEQGRIALSLEQQRALLAAKTQLEQDYLHNYRKTTLEMEEEVQRRREEIIMDGIQRQLMAQQGAQAAALSSEQRAFLQRQGTEERQKRIVADRIEFEKKSDLEKTQFAISNAQSVFAALGAQNKKAFEASKALAIATAIMNTYQGATKALATYPFPFGLIAAAAAVAAGMAQVAAIRSQQYSGRQLGGPVMGGRSYIVGENGPELFTPNTTGGITRNSDLGGGGSTNINFTIVANDSQGFDDLLLQRQGMIKQLISDAMIERGQRSMI